MMDVLRPIASEIFKCATQVVDLYIYAVYTFLIEDYVGGAAKGGEEGKHLMLHCVDHSRIFLRPVPSP